MSCGSIIFAYSIFYPFSNRNRAFKFNRPLILPGERLRRFAEKTVEKRIKGVSASYIGIFNDCSNYSDYPIWCNFTVCEFLEVGEGLFQKELD